MASGLRSALGPSSTIDPLSPEFDGRAGELAWGQG